MKSLATRPAVYKTPSCTVAEISTEGVLCSSLEQALNSIEDYVETTYNWN